MAPQRYEQLAGQIPVQRILARVLVFRRYFGDSTTVGTDGVKIIWVGPVEGVRNKNFDNGGCNFDKVERQSCGGHGDVMRRGRSTVFR